MFNFLKQTQQPLWNRLLIRYIQKGEVSETGMALEQPCFTVIYKSKLWICRSWSQSGKFFVSKSYCAYTYSIVSDFDTYHTSFLCVNMSTLFFKCEDLSAIVHVNNTTTHLWKSNMGDMSTTLFKSIAISWYISSTLFKLIAISWWYYADPNKNQLSLSDMC